MNKTRLLYFLLLCICFSGSAKAQNWQWGRTDLPANMIATDAAGNFYFAVSDTGTYWKGLIPKKYGHSDIFLVSTDCSGNFRWSKVIGGPYVDGAIKLMTDSLDGIYVYGFVRKDPAAQVHIDADTVLPDNYRNHLLVKYDTAGQYQWHIQPGPDTPIGLGTSTVFIENCEVGPAGNVVFRADCKSGVLADGMFVVRDTLFHTYMLAYNADASFRQGIALHLPGPDDLSYMKVTWDPRRDKFYAYKGATLFKDTLVEKSIALVKFSESGAIEWILQSDDTAAGASGQLTNVLVEASGDLFLGGRISDGNSFNGHRFFNSIKSGRNLLFVSRIGSDGHPVWTRECGAGLMTAAAPMMVYSAPVLGMSNLLTGSFDWTNSGRPIGNTGKGTGYFVRLDARTNTLLSLDTADALTLSPPATWSVLCGVNGANFYLAASEAAVPGFDTFSSKKALLKYGYADCAPLLSLKDAALQDAIKIYPNPVADQLFVEQAVAGTWANLYTISGQKVAETLIQQPRQAIDLSAQAPGMYLLVCISEQGRKEFFKIIKQ